MLQNVNPTRMELLSLKRRVALAVRGHRLLSEKRDEISRQLVQNRYVDLKALRKRVEQELLETTRRFMMARATMEPEHITAAMEVPTQAVQPGRQLCQYHERQGARTEQRDRGRYRLLRIFDNQR